MPVSSRPLASVSSRSSPRSARKPTAIRSPVANWWKQSLVSVPANPNALAIAKGLKISPATLDLVFAGQGKENLIETRGIPGGQAVAKTVTRKGHDQCRCLKGFKTRKSALLEKKDKLTAFHEDKGDINYSDDDMASIEKTNAEIARDEKLLGVLRDQRAQHGHGQRRRRRGVVPARSNGGVPVSSPRPFAMPKKQMSPIDLFCRAGALMTLAHAQAQVD